MWGTVRRQTAVTHNCYATLKSICNASQPEFRIGFLPQSRTLIGMARPESPPGRVPRKVEKLLNVGRLCSQSITSIVFVYALVAAVRERTNSGVRDVPDGHPSPCLTSCSITLDFPTVTIAICHYMTVWPGFGGVGRSRSVMSRARRTRSRREPHAGPRGRAAVVGPPGRYHQRARL
jgi:hypothetical protein